MAFKSSSANLDIRNRGGTEQQQQQKKKKKAKKLRSMKLSKMPSLKPSRRRLKSQFDHFSIDSSIDDDDASSELSQADMFCTSSDAKGKTFPEGNEFDGASFSSSSHRSSSSSSSKTAFSSRNYSVTRGGIEFRKTLRKSRSSRRAKSRLDQTISSLSSNASPNYLKATSCSERKNTHFQASSIHDSESTFNSINENKRNSHTSRSNSGSSGYKSMQTLRRTTSLRTLRILLDKSSVNRATCSSTLKDSKFPHNVELHQEEGESERISVAKVCPYNYCSLHGHRHSTAPPLKRLLSKRRRFLKTQKSMKLGTHSSLRRRKIFRRSSQGKEDAYLAEVLFGETSYPEESVEENLNRERNSIVAEHDTLETLSKHKETKLVGLENGDLPGVSVESSDMVPRSAPDDGREAAEDNSVISSASVSHTLQELGGATEDKTFARYSLVGDSDEVHKFHLHKKKHISMWHLIHQHVVSGLAEGAGREEKKQVGDTNRLPTPPSPSSPNFFDSQIANHNTDSQEIEFHKTYAIQMVRQAIEKILLPEVQDQPVSSDVTSEEEPLEKKHGEGGKLSIPTMTADKISGPKQEVTASKEGEEADQKAPKTWSNLKKLILLKRFIKELEKVRKFNPQKLHHLPLEPGQEAEKICLRHPTMDRKKSSEEWMLDYALQQAVSEMAPTQKRKVMLLIKAFETVVPPSAEQQIQLTFPKFKGIISRDSCCTESELDNNVSEATYRDAKAEEIVASNLDIADKTSITTGHNIASNSASDSGPFKLSDVLGKGKNGDSESPEQLINMYDQQSNLPGEHSHFNSPAKNSEFCSVDKPKALANDTLISSACVGGPLKELITPSREQRNVDSEQEIESIEAFGPVRDSEPHHSDHKAHKIEFDKEKHVSMWHLIHQRMVAALAVEGKTTKQLDKANEQHSDDANTPAAKESSCDSSELADSFQNNAMGDRDVDSQEVELRKIFAIKLVREAIEKILLPEVQDQSCDDQSTTSEIMSDQELTEKKDWEHSFVAYDSNKVGNDVSFNPEGTRLAAAKMSVSEDERTAPKVQNISDKQTPKGWSNLKKLILLKRFIKELEKVRKFNPQKPQHLPLKPGPEAEEVSLRHQLMDERRSAEEWMLDYALRKVVSELAPKQKRKVALLVKAFETVAPPSEEEPQIEVTFPKFKVCNRNSCGSGSEEDKFVSKASVADTEVKDVSPSSRDKISTITGKKSDVAMAEEAEKDTLSSFRLELLKDGNKSNDTNTRLDGLSSEKPSYGTKRVASFWNRESTATYNIASSTSSIESLKQPTPAKEQEKYISMWHMLCQHVVSAVATKVERQLLDEESEDEQLDGAKTSPQIRTGSSRDHTTAKGCNSGSQKVKFSQRDAVKLVEEAIEEILLPDIQDDSSDAQSIGSDIIPEQEEILEKNSSDVSIDSPKDSFREYNKSEVQDHTIMNQEEKVSMVGNKSDQKIPRNWNKLKKLILLKRSIKALENVRKSSSLQAPRNLPLDAGQEEENSEKVDLRHQLQDERKKAEEWMLDYSLQHIVTKLTPARKRRVSILVEAFEAVVPLPEI